MSAVKLPRPVEEKLAELAARVRRLWLYRGLSWFAGIALVSAMFAVLFDARFGLPGWGRGVLCGTWVLAMLFAGWRLIVRPLRNQLPVPLLAAAIEREFPSLSERLATLVELSDHAEPGNGSLALIGVLARDTARRTKPLDFGRAAPTASVVRGLVAGVAAVLLVAGWLSFVPGAGQTVRRFLLPFYEPPPEPGFKVTATAGNIVAKRGEAVTLSAVLERTKPDAVLPDIAVVVCKDADATKKLPMAGDEKAAFHVTRPQVTAAFEYRVEAGAAASDWFRVDVVDAVELAAGSTFTLEPPAYARPPHEPRTHPGLHEFDALQYSKVLFDLKFTRPAAAAVLDWKPANPTGVVQGRQIFAKLSADRTAGTADWTLEGDGTLTLTLTGEMNVRTQISVATRATIDAPPKFEKVTNVTDRPREVRPDDRVVVQVTATDDLKVDKVQFEYQVNDREVVREVPMPLPGVGTPRADGRFAFDVAGGGIKEGDTLRYRVRAFDNRRVPDQDKGPQSAAFPEQGWATLKVTASAKPLAEQDVLAKRDEIAAKLKAMAKEVEEAQRAVERVKADVSRKGTLAPNEIAALENARGQAKDVAQRLDDLARQTGLTPDLRPLADGMREVADDMLRKADDRVRKAVNEPDANERDGSLQLAVGHLDAAVSKLNDLVGANDRAARDRLDRAKLEELAEKERELAAEAKKADDPAKAAEVARKQKQLQAELDELLKGNDDLRRAADAAAADEAKALAEKAKKLREEQERLDRAAKDAEAADRKRAADAAGERQKEIAEKADELAKKTKGQAKQADAPPLDPKPAANAADKLAGNDPVGAMTEQEKAARELDRLADAIERAAGARTDPKEAARQLAKLEDELRRQHADAAGDADRQAVANAQEAVKRATAAITPPPGDAAAAAAKKDAADKLERAKDALAKNPPDAQAAMKQAADALRTLSDKLPSREQRLKQAGEELSKLQREQEAVRKDAEEKLKGFDKRTPDAAARKEAADKLADAAKKQGEIADKVEKLDAPGLEGRRQKAADAARRAADDLRDGLPQDVPASQQDAKRQEERLQQAMNGQKPADELADELAKKQQRAADAAAKPDASQKQVSELQREIADQLGGLKDPDAAERLSLAKEAVKAAGEAAAEPDADELRKKTKDAADAMNALADQLAGAESDADRAERLAKERRDAADRSQQAAGKPADAGETAAAQADLDRQAADLRQTRAGRAQEAKKRAADALDKLRKSPHPERAPGLQKQAADAAQALADQMKGNGDRTAKGERGSPDGEPADDAGGRLPSKADADAARDLAARQRQARDQLARANELAGQGAKPTDGAEVQKLAAEQQELANEAGKLAGESGPPAAREAADAAKKAADELKAGATEQAQASGAAAQKKMGETAEQGAGTPAGKAAEGMAERQQKLNERMAAADPGAAAAQRQTRQGELAKQAGELSKELAGSNGKDADAAKKASDAAKEAGKQMDRARTEGQAGRPGNAADARKKAGDALKKAEEQANKAAGQPNGGPEPGANAKQAGQAAQDAGQAMNEAGKQLGQKDGKAAGEAMNKAAGKLDEAAGKLGQPDAKGEPNQAAAGGGPTPGGNDGSGKAPPTGDIPADLTQYLGKPWGELPGDVRAKIYQDLTAKYGEDYAKRIKLYFEQLAERK